VQAPVVEVGIKLVDDALIFDHAEEANAGGHDADAQQCEVSHYLCVSAMQQLLAALSHDLWRRRREQRLSRGRHCVRWISDTSNQACLRIESKISLMDEERTLLSSHRR
jgi:hypothetical protein